MEYYKEKPDWTGKELYTPVLKNIPSSPVKPPMILPENCEKDIFFIDQIKLANLELYLYGVRYTLSIELKGNTRPVYRREFRIVEFENDKFKKEHALYQYGSSTYSSEEIKSADVERMIDMEEEDRKYLLDEPKWKNRNQASWPTHKEEAMPFLFQVAVKDFMSFYDNCHIFFSKEDDQNIFKIVTQTL